MGRNQLNEFSADEIRYVLEQYIHNVRDRQVMAIYLIDCPSSLERLAEICDLSLSTVKRIICRSEYIYRYFIK